MTLAYGKTVLITGGAMGMGKQLALLFAREGAKIILWDMNAEELDKTGEQLRKLGADVHVFALDITDVEKCREARDKTHEAVGKLDILVNNAGVVFGGLFLDVPLEKHLKTIAVNINAVMTCTYLFLPDLIEKREGHIINLASAAGFLGVPNLTSYSASKFAVVGFTESLRMELRKMNLHEIRTTTVCPSVVSTGMFDGMKAPQLNPILTPEKMASKIYEGMKKNKSYVKEPFMVKTIPMTKALLPAESVYAMCESLKVNTSMDSWKGRSGK